ncbi:MAG: hypothetical protein ACTXOO_00490 [Sodalis sp. (in: enterobacteria)]
MRFSIPIYNAIIYSFIWFTTQDCLNKPIEDKDAILLYLPLYLPDLNLIEMTFPKLGLLPRKAAERTFDSRWNATAQAIDLVFHKNYYHFLGARYKTE